MQNVHHVQHAVLEAKKEFEDTHGAGDKLQMC